MPGSRQQWTEKQTPVQCDGRVTIASHRRTDNWLLTRVQDIFSSRWENLQEVLTVQHSLLAVQPGSQ